MTDSLLQAKYTRLLSLQSHLDTPALIVDWEQVQANLKEMQGRATRAQVRLRPHVKTHKSIIFSQLQVQKGAVGLTAAKLGEAEVMVGGGATSVFIANQVVQEKKMSRLRELRKKSEIILAVDHVDQLRIYEQHLADIHNPFALMIEIDSGLGRCGLANIEDVAALVKEINCRPGLTFEGIFTHAGQVYGASPEEVPAVARREVEVMEETARALVSRGFPPAVVSIGSTPTLFYTLDNLPSDSPINEVRPGVYLYGDGLLHHLGVCSPEQWALFVLATVVSRPDEKRVVVNSGSKALNLDRGAHSNTSLTSYGTVVSTDAVVERLSEEHGILRVPPKSPLKIGDPLLIVPNHACAVVNLFSQFYLVDRHGKYEIFPVEARGRLD